MDTMSEKASIVDPEVRAFVFSLVAALGGSSAADNGRYVLGDDALAVLKDIKRWLRLYDDRLHRLDVARLLAEANLIKGDLLEILATWPEDAVDSGFRSKIALLCVDLLTQLTWPIQNDELREVAHHYLHVPFLETAQASYKRVILHHDTAKVLRTAIRVALPAISTSQKERSPMEDNIIKVVLYLFRNIALIKQPEGAIVDEGDSDISRSATINAFHYQDVFNLLLMICSGMQESFGTHEIEVLDILYNLLRGVDVERLFMEADELVSSHTEELQGLLSKEKGMHAGYARHAPTRHNRFGTLLWVKRDGSRHSVISGQKAITNDQSALEEMDKSKKWKKPRRPVKAAKNEETKDGGNNGSTAQEVFNTTIPLTNAARRHLRGFIEQFLDSSFNPLFTAVRRAIEREVDRAQGSVRQYLFLTSWFLRAERARRTKPANMQKSAPSQDTTESFALIAGVVVQENFVLLNREMQSAFDNKRWQDLNAGMKCFTEILLTVQEMSESHLEEDQEIAENILSRIFYEQTTHDRVNTLLKSYNNQGFDYLDACTELSHVFLRLLERYSKQNVDMQIRSRRRARKKKAVETQPEGQELERTDRGQEAEDIAEAQRVSKERKFDFTKYAAKSVSQSSVDTFVAFLRFYNDLSTDQMKRAHRFFYRIAFKMEMSVLLFRMDFILLFQKLVKGPDGLILDSPLFRDWEELVGQLFRQLTKKLQERPELAVELLFSKIPATMFYLQWGYEKETPKKVYRPPAELEVKPGMDVDQQIGVVVSVLINQTKSDALAWVKEALSSASAERKAWEDEAAARLALDPVSQPEASVSEGTPAVVSTGNEADATEAVNQTTPNVSTEPRAPSIFVKPDTPERRLQMQRDKHVRLLMKLVGFVQLISFAADEEDSASNAAWIVPSSLTSKDLTTSALLIQNFEFAPPTYDDGKSAEDFLRRKVNKPVRPLSDAELDNDINFAPRSRRPRRASFVSSEGDSDVDVDKLTSFAPGGPTDIHADKPRKKPLTRGRRTRHAPDEHLDPAILEDRAAARRKLEAERSRKIKSELFVHASDDESDEERDRDFFAREEERRLRNVKGGKVPAAVPSAKPTAKEKRGGKRKTVVIDDDENDGNDNATFTDDEERPGRAASSSFPARMNNVLAASPPTKKRRTGLAALMFDDSDSDIDGISEHVASHDPVTKSTSPGESEAETEPEDTPPSSATVVAERDADGDLRMASGGESDKENEGSVVAGKSIEMHRSRRALRAGFVVESDEDE